MRRTLGVVVAVAALAWPVSAWAQDFPPPIDRQVVQDQDDMTWADYKPVPNHNWADNAIQPTVRNLKIRGIDTDDNLLLVEGAVPGTKGAYVVILKAKKPPRERRGFAGSTTLDPLKAAKKAAAGKAKK